MLPIHRFLRRVLQAAIAEGAPWHRSLGHSPGNLREHGHIALAVVHLLRRMRLPRSALGPSRLALRPSTALLAHGSSSIVLPPSGSSHRTLATIEAHKTQTAHSRQTKDYSTDDSARIRFMGSYLPGISVSSAGWRQLWSDPFRSRAECPYILRVKYHSVGINYNIQYSDFQLFAISRHNLCAAA